MPIELRPLDARIPRWDLDDLVSRHCPFCSSREAEERYIRPDRLKVHHCPRCGAFFVSPVPSIAQMERFYAIYDAAHRRNEPVAPGELAERYAGIDPLDDPRIQELHSLVPIRGSRFLDIGFGRAELLDRMRRLGAIPHGIEMDPKAIEYARAIGIADVFEGSLEDYPEDRKFDAIAMHDLIEHPPMPMVLLGKAASLLADRGVLSIWTPNGEAAAGEDQPITFRVDLEHLQYLTPDTVPHLARQLGLRIVHLETVGHPFLEGIECAGGIGERPASTAGLAGRARRHLRKVPGAGHLGRLLRALRRPEPPRPRDREGAYHLFFILQKRESSPSPDGRCPADRASSAL